MFLQIMGDNCHKTLFSQLDTVQGRNDSFVFQNELETTVCNNLSDQNKKKVNIQLQKIRKKNSDHNAM